MGLHDTPDGGYTHAVTTANEGDGNDVVYDNWIVPGQKTPVWDKFSYEDQLRRVGIIRVNPNQSNLPPDNPIVDNPPNDNNRSLKEPKLIARGVNPIGMAYWRNINNHAGRSYLSVVLAVNDELLIYSVDKNTLNVIEARASGIHHTGEGIHFSAINSDILFIPFSKSYEKFNIRTGQRETLWSASGYNLWQPHISYDERTISATMQNGQYEPTDWAIWKDGRVRLFEMRNNPDECQVDKSGDFLLVKEKQDLGNDKWNEYIRIIRLSDNSEYLINNNEGAIGHSDNGFGFGIGENDVSQFAGAADYINFNRPSERINMYSTGIWNMGYVSLSSSKPLIPMSAQRMLITTPYDLIQVKLDGNGIGEYICANLTESQEYSDRPKANMCPHGQYAIWTARVSGSLNAYIVGLP